MLKKFFLLLIVVFLFITAFYLLIRQYYHINEKMIFSQLEKPSEDISLLLKEDSNSKFPFKIPEGLHISVFADLKIYGMPRVLAVDSNGVLFSTLTQTGKLVALPDKNSDGIVDEVIVVKSGLKNPHGLVFHNNQLFLAEEDKVVRYDYDSENYQLENEQILFGLPESGRHFTRTIKILGEKLYTSVGSSCDVCLEKDAKRAAILISNLDGSDLQIFAKGLRNTVFFTFDPSAGSGQVKMWGNDMGRDFLGDNLPPDELNVIEEGRNYGWPYCYGKSIRDLKFRELEALERCRDITQPSTFDYPAHVAPLGITFINSDFLGKDNQGDLLIAFHGSWNSSLPVGYKIVKLNLSDDKVVGMEDFITGWYENGKLLGRPVDLLFKDNQTLFISDDKAGVVYILTKNNK